MYIYFLSVTPHFPTPQTLKDAAIILTFYPRKHIPPSYFSGMHTSNTLNPPEHIQNYFRKKQPQSFRKCSGKVHIYYVDGKVKLKIIKVS